MSVVELEGCLMEELSADTLTPILIFKKLEGRKKILLESSLKHMDSGRYSFVAANPAFELKTIGDENEILRLDEKRYIQKGKTIDAINELIAPFKTDLKLFPFIGGGVGYIGYDVISQYEYIGQPEVDDLNMPDAHLMFFEDIIVFDHLKQKVTLIVHSLEGEADLYKKLEVLKASILAAKEIDYNVKTETVVVKPTISQAHFLSLVEKAKEYIVSGDIFQIVLSQRLKAEFDGDAFDYYRKLRTENPSPYLFYLDFEDYIILGASPESLVKVNGSTVMTNPIAGTRRRGQTEEEDRELAVDLQQDEKELAEHKMLVDLGRNDLGRICDFATVNVNKYMEVERYTHVMHLVSEVTGKLSEHVTPLDALIACLPAGTVSGAPKIRAMQLINEFERVKRGVYGGAVGYISFNGDIDFALAIRTMVIKEKAGYVQAGAGIVYDSDPLKEYEETLHKAKALLEVMK